MTIPEPIAAAMDKESSDWAAVVHLAILEVWDGATRSEVKVGAFLNGKLRLSIGRGMIWGTGKIKEESCASRAELVRVRVEGGEAGEVIDILVGTLHVTERTLITSE